jgi:uncharacterized NAD(P)/FAD-binding protein YdhS
VIAEQVSEFSASQRQTADVAIVGAGASGAHSLLAILKELSSATEATDARTRRTQIVVIDRDPQFFAGVAYGRRSGRSSLTLSTVQRFLPTEEREDFVEWLNQHRDDVLSDPDLDEAWIDRHRDAIVSGQWEPLFIPRRLYGKYLAECVSAAIWLARSQNVAEFSLINAVVTSLTEAEGRYRLGIEDAEGAAGEIDAAVVVLAIGSPPARELNADGDAVADGVVRDVYDPGLEQTLARVRVRLEDLPQTDRRVLVVGGNAAALEFVLAAHTFIRNLGATITVLSPSGRPRHWRRKKPGELTQLPALTALKASADAGQQVSAADLYEAVAADLAAALASGADVAAVPAIMDVIPSFLGVLGSQDREALAAEYGMRITNLLREDCSDAVDILDTSIAAGIISFEAGRYWTSRRRQSGFEVTVIDRDGLSRKLDSRYGVVIGAVGFETVSATRSPLLRQLLDDGVVHVSSSDRGLRADSRFRVAPRLFVTGPLLAGNANASMLIWHAESVRRILEIARSAAPHIVHDLLIVSSGNSLSA